MSQLARLAERGMSFADEIAAVRARNDLRRRSVAGNSPSAEELRIFEERMQVVPRAAEEAASRIRKIRADAPILLAASRAQHAYDEYAGGKIVKAGSASGCPEPERKWYLEFAGGWANGVRNVTNVADGLVGWRNLPTIQAPADQETTNTYQLRWHCSIPHEGTYSYWFAAPQARLRLRYSLTGTGIWTTDAWLSIHVRSWFGIGDTTVQGYSATVVSETKESFGTHGGAVDRWIPVATNGMVRVAGGESCWVTIDLTISHWHDTGSVWVKIDDFWYPSVDPNRDIAISD